MADAGKRRRRDEQERRADRERKFQENRKKGERSGRYGNPGNDGNGPGIQKQVVPRRPALEWLANLCSHIPNRGEQMVRYYGCYSNVSRENDRKKAATRLSSVSSNLRVMKKSSVGIGRVGFRRLEPVPAKQTVS
jgi:hypothetical protein